MSAFGQEAIPEIREVLGRHGELLEQARAAGAQLGALDELAASWAAADFTAEGVELWCAARCARPQAARLLHALRVPLEAAGRQAEAAGIQDTLGFLAAADLLGGPAEILVAAGVSTLLLDEHTALTPEAGERRAGELAATAAAALEELAELLDSQVTPIVANDVAYRALEAIRYASIAVEKLGTRSIEALADYLEYTPAGPVPDRDGAHELADRLKAFGEDGYTTLYRRGREEFFGAQHFNPSGFGIRLAMKDGRRVEEFLDDHERQHGADA